MLASPLMLLVTLLCVTLRITGMPELPELVSPLPPAEDDPPGRSTVLRNVTVAAKTGFGGEEESVTRTMIG